MVGELLAGLFLIGLGTVLFRYSRLISNWLWNFDNQIRKDVAGTFLEKTIYNENYWLSWGTIARKAGPGFRTWAIRLIAAVCIVGGGLIISVGTGL